MLEELGGLRKYWHIIGFSNEISKSKFFKRKFYGKPIIIGRNENGNLSGMFDVCPHMKGPITFISKDGNNGFACKYHGWKFDENGKLLKIPSSPNLNTKFSCKLNSFLVREEGGFIWILIDKTSEERIPEIELEKGFSSYFSSSLFHTTEELLIENFMDATHTPIVHNKIIRDDSSKTIHNIQVSASKNSVFVKFDDNVENVGGFLSKFFYKKLIISHTDEFLPPNLVRVKYFLNGKHRFQALIGCTTLEDGKTKAFVKIDYNFGFFNFLLKLFIGIIAKKVLLQDFEITKQQYENRKIFSDLKDLPIDYDFIHITMKMLREKIKNEENIENWELKKNIKIEV